MLVDGSTFDLVSGVEPLLELAAEGPFAEQLKPEKALEVMEGVLIELPVLLALSTNSPFWRGEATGLHSTRAMIFAAFPRSGISPRFESYRDYADGVGFMEATGAIGDYTHLW